MLPKPTTQIWQWKNLLNRTIYRTKNKQALQQSKKLWKSNARRSNPTDKSPGKTPDQRRVPEYNMEQETTSDIIPINNNKEHNMDISLNTKRPHQTPAPLSGRQWIKPVPNTNVARNYKNKKKKDKNNKP